MYESFYSLTSMPFQLTPDSRFFFDSQEHRKAMAFLQYGIAQQEGFVVVTGEIGAGKTTLVEHLLANLDPAKHVAGRIATTQLDGYDILCMIAGTFGIAGEGIDKGALIGRIRQVFAELQQQGKHPLVIVDEAQSLPIEAIEELRMLSNLSVGARAPFQGILLGQPEFRTTLSKPSLQQFRQRVIASCHLGALGLEDTRRYIEHRLTRVGWSNDPAFSEGAFQEIYRCTDGVPRRINTLCSRLLLLGYLEEKHAIEADEVVNVASELASELGALTANRETSADVGFSTNTDTGGLLDELRLRLSRVERVADRHDRAIHRVLDLALKYLPAQNSK